MAPNQMSHYHPLRITLFVFVVFTGCGLIPQTELQDASVLGSGRGTLSVTPSPWLEARYQYGVTDWSDASISGYANIFAFAAKGHEGSLRLQWKQALTEPRESDHLAALFATQWYSTAYDYSGSFGGTGPTNKVTFSSFSPSVGLMYSHDVYFDPLGDEHQGEKRWIINRFPWLKIRSLYMGTKLTFLQSYARYTDLVFPNTTIVHRSDTYVYPFIGMVAGNDWRLRLELGVGHFISIPEKRPKPIVYPSISFTFPLRNSPE